MSDIFFDEIKAYIGFDESDAATLRALSPHLKPHFADIVNAFYTALNANPRSRHIFDGEAQIERLRRTLIVWLEGVFGGVYDAPYFQQRLNIGRVHVNVGLQPHFMFGAMNVIRRELLDRKPTLLTCRLQLRADAAGLRRACLFCRILSHSRSQLNRRSSVRETRPSRLNGAQPSKSSRATP